VVDRSWCRHRGHKSSWKIPVGRHCKHCFGTRNLFSDSRPAICPYIAYQCVHRVAVTEENDRHWLRHVYSPFKGIYYSSEGFLPQFFAILWNTERTLSFLYFLWG